MSLRAALLPLLLLWAWPRGGWRPAAALVFGAALVLLPVALRNLGVGGEFHLTTSQTGPNFYIGNGPQADGGYVALREGRGTPEFERTDATEIAEAASGQRTPLAPGLPTMIEAGYRDFELSTFVGLYVPARTPPSAIATVSTALQQALKDSELRSRYADVGTTVAPMSPVQSDAYTRTAVLRYRALEKLVGGHGQ